MKPFYTLISICILLNSTAYSQWATNANNIFNTNSGYVGIGTPLPENPLQIKTATPGWLVSLKAPASNPGEINGIKFYSGYIGDTNKWAGISSVTEDIHSNNTGLVLYTATTEKMRILGNGNIGMGTSNPNAKLAMFQPTQLGENTQNNSLLLSIGGNVGSGNNLQHNIWLIRREPGNNWYSAGVHDGLSIDDKYLTPKIDSRTWWDRDPMNNIQSWGDQKNTYLVLDKGNVGIGTTELKGNKLSVNGTIHAKEVKVDMIDWPDYVFNSNYELLNLTELNIYIMRHKHLPGIPSALEITTKGLNIGDISSRLINKVEELTLYLIEKDNQLKTQQDQIDELKKQLHILLNSKKQDY